MAAKAITVVFTKKSSILSFIRNYNGNNKNPGSLQRPLFSFVPEKIKARAGITISTGRGNFIG
jgi:hypothetical protein